MREIPSGMPTGKPTSIHAWAATKPKAALSTIEGPVPTLGAHDVLIEVSSCGICHSDIHLIDNDWQYSQYPLVPGHEILGRVVALGSHVKHLHPEMVVGVGWQRGSCLECEDCVTSRENLCPQSQSTCVGFWGGYADYHVTDSRFAFPMPDGCREPRFAPILCGGATVYSPLVEMISPYVGKAARVGIVGLGGLGHLAVKFAAAMGYEVTLFSSSPSKKAEAEKLGVHQYVLSNNDSEIEKLRRKLDLVLVTANVDLPWGAYLKTLRGDGTLCFVGIPPSPLKFAMTDLLGNRGRVAASPIGSRARIREMLEFCARHDIGADVELFKFSQLNEALSKVRENKVRHRAVLVR